MPPAWPTRVNPRLVRGMDYYNLTVFEWITDRLGAQGTICGGGRYDGLFEQLGGKPTPAVGFASGLERVVLLLEELGLFPAAAAPAAYAIVPSAAALPRVMVASRSVARCWCRSAVACRRRQHEVAVQARRRQRCETTR